MAQSIARARVIALKGSTRLEGFFACPGTAQFDVFDAFDGRADPSPREFDHAAFRTRHGVDATAGEVGCVMSHSLILREFASQPGAPEDLVLIAEDDARPSEDFPTVLERLLALPVDLDYVVLASPFDHAGRRPLNSTGSRLTQLSLLSRPVGGWPWPWRYAVGHFDGSAWGAGLYLVSRRAARAYWSFVESSGGISWAADESHFFAPRAGIDVRVVVPNLAGWEGSSTIRDTADIVVAEQRAREEAQMTGVARLQRQVALRTRAGYARRRLAATLADLRRGGY